MRRTILILFIALGVAASFAQNEVSAFKFLDLPVSAHAAGLGGENISLVNNDLGMALLNPALLASVASKSIHFGYMSYIADAAMGSVGYTQHVGERGVWAVSGRYVGYGDFKGTDEFNNEESSFSVKDMAFSGLYSYDLSERWSGGVAANVIYGSYASYSSLALGVDLGLNYYNGASNFSFSVVARNLGGQLKAFQDTYESLPFNLVMGLTKRIENAPIQLSITGQNLTDWKAKTINGKKDSFTKTALNHLVLGVDLIPTNNFYLALGYNLKRASELKIAEANTWAGFSIGAGLYLKKANVGVSYSKYHVSSSSLLLNLALKL